MSQAFAQRHHILAVAVTDEEVEVASAEPWITQWEKDLEHAVRRRVKRVLADPREITKHTREFYAMAHSVQGARSANRSSHGRLANLESMLELGVKGEPDANDQHIVGVVDWLLQYAFEQRASDIHMEPRRDVGLVRLRIDGVLHKVYELPAAVAAAVTSRFKILARLDVAEKTPTTRWSVENPNAGWCGGWNCDYRPCQRRLAKNWLCGFSIQRCCSNHSKRLD